MGTSRRTLLKMGTAGLAGLPFLAGKLNADAAQPDVEHLRGVLTAHRARLRTLHVQWRIIAANGEAIELGELYSDNGRDHLRITEGQRTKFLVATLKEHVGGFAGDKRTVRRGKTTKWPMGVSIESFLPAFSEGPVGFEGLTRVGGEPCVVALQNHLRYFISLSTPTVLRTEALAPKGRIWRIEDFSSFVPTADEIYFPRMIQQQINDRDGNFVKAFTIFIDAVETNGALDEGLFDLNYDGGPR